MKYLLDEEVFVTFPNERIRFRAVVLRHAPQCDKQYLVEFLDTPRRVVWKSIDGIGQVETAAQNAWWIWVEEDALDTALPIRGSRIPPGPKTYPRHVTLK